MLIKSEVKNLPLGLLLLDEGELVKTMAEKIPENAGDRISFEIYTSSEELEQALDEKEIYGALVFPKDFSEKLISLQGEKSEQALVQIYINEGQIQWQPI